MNYSMCLKKLRAFFLSIFFRERHNKRPKISLLIPFSSKDPIRKRSFKWLIQYWKHELPDAEIIIGKSRSRIFCKGEALNDAVERSRGEILAILDADAYLDGKILDRCADRILEEISYGHRLWYVPYMNLYRLTKKATAKVLDSDPECPYRFTSPPPSEDTENQGHTNKYGRRYGAMLMMFPREAYESLGCFDERFQGWGGEDVALLRALDTLYVKHKNTKNDILHLWHPFIGEDYRSRRWKGQDRGSVNSELANKYHRASRHPKKMRELVDDSFYYKLIKDLKYKK
jgi:hypothetical protein